MLGGLFQRYCLCASAPTAAEATSFEFVARQKDGERTGGPDPSSPGGGDASMERLRAQQSPALRAAGRAEAGPPCA